MSFVTLDIETVPQARHLDPEAWREDGELKLDEDYLEEMAHEAGPIRFEIEQGRAVLAATKQPAALHATTCHIVQVSFGWRGPAGELCRKVVQSDQWSWVETPCTDVHRLVNDRCENCGMACSLRLAERAERHLVSTALDMVAGACQKGSTIVSFNGKQFDIPVLRARAAILCDHVHSLPPIPWRKLLYPYADDRHADLRLVLGADDRRARGTLQFWADTLGIHAEEHGRDVFGWVQANEWGKLEAYGMVEAATLVEMYERVRPIL